MRRTLILAGTVAALCLPGINAEAGNTWTGGGASTNWSDNNNWGGGAPGYGTLTFTTGGVQGTTSVNNSITAMNQLFWTGSSSWTLNNSGGTVLSLFDNGGTQAKIENQSTGLVTINAPITFAANNSSPPNPFGEINAVNGGITFGSGTLTVNGTSVNGVKLFGSNQTTTFNNTVSSSGKWFGLTGANTTAAVGGSFTSGDIYVMNGGTLKVNTGAAITTSALRLGGDFGNTGNGQNNGTNSSGNNTTGTGGTLQFTSLTGGQSFASVINTVTGNTSNALLIDSLNTSGTNTLAGASFLDSDLKTQVATGGTLSFTGGSIDVKTRKLTVSGGGTTVINEALTSSFTAGGLLVKEGAGTLILQGTSNSYTGTNAGTLNANGTAINAGTLGIYADTSLGLAPSGAYNNIQFTGSATLQDTANNISLNANRNISIASGATASLDSNGNTFTINGVLNGSGGAVTKTGSGSVVLTNAGNSYTGPTTVSQGTLEISGSISASSQVDVTGGTLLLTGAGNKIGNTAPVSLSNGTTLKFADSGAGGFTEVMGTLTLSGTSTLDFGTGTTNGNQAFFAGLSSGTVSGLNGGTITLNIWNWSGSTYGIGQTDPGTNPAQDRLVFDVTTGLNSAGLARINFYSGANTGFLGTGNQINFGASDFEIVPVPEPSTTALWFSVGLLGLIGYRERRRVPAFRRA
jgi:autotransporter-associated beta strand protein